MRRLQLLLRSRVFLHSQHSLPKLGLGFQNLPPPHFSSDASSSSPSDSSPPSSEPPGRQPAAAIRPVSYPVKPKEESSAPPESESPQAPGEVQVPEQPEFQRPVVTMETRTWTRADTRFVRDVQAIAPVSYPAKVAPLPEDRVEVEVEVEEKEEGFVKRDLFKEERMRIASMSMGRRVFGLRKEEEVDLPFPTLMKVEKKEPKAPLELLDAIRKVKANARRKFTETVEAHVVLGVDPRRSDQTVRGAVTLPHGTGKIVRVAVFAEGPAADDAREAGADVIGGDELIEEIKKSGGKLNFDKCIATPNFMPRLGKIARILGPRGLMPNPKLGSLTSDVAGAVKQAKSGRIDFRVDKTAIVHVGLGKVDFAEESLQENIGAFVNALLVAKPVGLKKTSKYAGYVNSFHLCSTMGPGFPVMVQSLSLAADNYCKLHPK